MSRTRFLLWIATAFGLATGYLSAASVVSRGTPVTLSQDISNLLLPNWSGGALVVVEGDNTATPLFRLFDMMGRPIAAVPLAIPNARLISILGFSRGGDGTLAVCGSAFDAEGRGAPFLAIITANKLQLVRTTPYIPQRVTVSADGTVWTVGIEPRELGKTETQPATMPVNSKAAVIRHFSTAGEIIGAFIPHSEIDNPASITAADNFVGSAKDRIGWYCSREHRYIEILADGSVHDTRGIVLPAGATGVTGMAIVASSDVLLSTQTAGGSNICLVNTAGKSCDLVQNSSDLGHIYGADGDTVMSSGKGRSLLNSFELGK